MMRPRTIRIFAVVMALMVWSHLPRRLGYSVCSIRNVRLVFTCRPPLFLNEGKIPSKVAIEIVGPERGQPLSQFVRHGEGRR